MVSDISSGLVIKNKNVLMVQNEDENWEFPTATGKTGELSADTAERAVTDLTGCEAEVSRYRDRLKTKLEKENNELTWQPYNIDIQGKPEKGEWVPVKKLEEIKLPGHLEKVREKLCEKL